MIGDYLVDLKQETKGDLRVVWENYHQSVMKNMGVLDGERIL